jgi:hypothetical protein
MAMKNKKGSEKKSPSVNQADFLNSDGYLKGGIDIEMTSKDETQYQVGRGQRRMLPEKKKTTKWF